MMNQPVHIPEVYDFRQYDRIWQRVAPNLEPYPGMGAQAAVPGSPPAPGSAPVTGTATGSPAASGAPAAPAVPVPVEPAPAAPGSMASLPGADPNPCCMGTAAAEMLTVLTAYAEDALSDRQAVLALARVAPSWARQRLRDMAADLGEHARRLMAVHYLITGSCYQPSLPGAPARPAGWRPGLRERYHAAACSGLNYARSADDTADPCLADLLNGLSAEAYRHANMLLQLLERSLQERPRQGSGGC